MLYRISIILLFLLKIEPLCAQSIHEDLINCQNSGTLKVNENASVEHLEAAIETAKSQKGASCAKAEASVRRLENLASKLEYSIAQVKPALEESLSRGDKVVNDQLAKLNIQLQTLRSIPEAPGKVNRERIVDIRSQSATTNTDILKLNQNWDGVFKPKQDSPLEVINTLAKDQILSGEVRNNLLDFLKKIPPYLLGNGPAPREKIEFLQRQNTITQQSITLKETLYSKPIRDEANRNIQEGLSPEVVINKALVIRQNLLKEFLPYDVTCSNGSTLWGSSCITWASEARRSGACTLAAQKVRFQLNAIKNTITLANEKVKPTLTSTLENDINSRVQFLSETNCSQKNDHITLLLSLAEMQNILPVICRNRAPDIDEKVNGLIADISNYINFAEAVNQKDRDSFHNVGAHLWSFAFYFKRNCPRWLR